MPIYAYRCPDCGHAQDHLMKMSDASPACPSCASSAYAKQVTSAAFALKGNGYYATDFKGPVDGSVKSAPSESTASGGCGGSCPCHPH